MTTTATLENADLTLDPGAEAVVPVQIHNNSTVVEAYDLSVVGTPAGWATIEPAQVTLYPGTSTSAAVTLRPPRTARTPAGAHEFGVMVQPTEHPDQAVVPEGVVEVLPYLETTAELVPRTSQGRKGRHQVAIDNRGNVPVNVVVEPRAESDRLKFKQKQKGLMVDPGEARFTALTIKSRQRIWRGQPVTHPFVVEVRPETSTPVELQGSYVQTPVIPKWLLWLLLGLLLLLLLLAALWFWLLKPTIESQAREAAEEAAAEAEEAAEQAEQGANAARNSAADAQEAADQAERDAGRERPPRTIVAEEGVRLNVVADGETSDADERTFGEDTTFAVTDVVFSNPQGDSGRVRFLVDGDVQLAHALENFRDLDFHFVTPIIAEDEVEIEVSCRTPGTPPDAGQQDACDIAAFIGGETTTIPPEE